MGLSAKIEWTRAEWDVSEEYAVNETSKTQCLRCWKINKKWSAQQQCNSSKEDSHILLIKLRRDNSRECISWQSSHYGVLPHKETASSLLENSFFCLTNEYNCLVNFAEVLPKSRLNVLWQSFPQTQKWATRSMVKTDKLALKWTLSLAVRVIQSELTF